MKRRVLITGANGGIGRELVTGFLKDEWEVIATYRSDPGVLLELSKENEDNLHLFQLDLSKEREVDELYRTLAEKGLEPNSVIANAGKFRVTATPLHEMSLVDWEDTLAANLTTSFLTARGFFRSVAQNIPVFPPSLVLIGSTAGTFGEANHSDYAASKAALQYGWLKSLKNEIVRLHPAGRVNAIAPGWTLTSMARGVLENRDLIGRTLQTIPLRKFGTPRDVCESALFLADPERSGHISGHLLEMSGGMEGRVLFTSAEVGDNLNKLGIDRG